MLEVAFCCLPTRVEAKKSLGGKLLVRFHRMTMMTMLMMVMMMLVMIMVKTFSQILQNDDNDDFLQDIEIRWWISKVDLKFDSEETRMFLPPYQVYCDSWKSHSM